MPAVLYLIAVIELFGGVGTFMAAKSAIHEILATLLIGFSFLTMALGAILEELRRSRADGIINITK